MSNEKRPGWKYFKSETLNEEFALHEETGWVYFKNGARYSPDEIKLISDTGGMIDIETHKVKTVVKGDIVEYSNQAENQKQAPSATVQGELDIY